MTLSEKSESLPEAQDAGHKDPDREVKDTARSQSSGSLIERWDAFERRLASAVGRDRPAKGPAKSASQGVPDDSVAVSEPAGSAPAAIDEEALLQDLVAPEALDTDTADAPSGLKPNEADKAPAPQGTEPPSDRNRYTQVRYSMKYGSAAKRPKNAEARSAPAGDSGLQGAGNDKHASATTEQATEHLLNPDAADSKPREADVTAAQHKSAAAASTSVPKTKSGRTEAKKQAGRPNRTEAAAVGPDSSDLDLAAVAQAAPAANRAHEDGVEARANEDGAAQGEGPGGQALARIDVDHLEVGATDEGPSASSGSDAASEASHSHYGRSIVAGMLLVVFGIGGFLTWATLAPLSSGVVATGTVKVQGERKTVQHLEGGIIKDLLVNEGDEVKEGQVLIRLDGRRANAVLDTQSSEYFALLAKRSRLQSERRNLPEVEFHEELLAVADNPDIAELMEAERTLFADRKSRFEDQLKIFDSWVEGYKREISGLEAQKTATAKQLVHIKDELNSFETLYKKGIVTKTRLLELKRTAAGLNGQTGSLTASIARAEEKIGEATLRGVSLRAERTETISTELSSVENDIRRIKEQLPAQRDVVDRLEIRAPRSGRVVNLNYHTAGGVITSSTPILDIVPEDDQLLIEARVRPVDIDVLKPGMEAQITLTAYSQRSTPPVTGRLLQVSADRVEDASTGEAYYQAYVEVDMEALAALPQVKLYPGMPASVQFVGGARTPMDYLLSPIEAGLRNSWLEQ